MMGFKRCFDIGIGRFWDRKGRDEGLFRGKAHEEIAPD